RRSAAAPIVACTPPVASAELANAVFSPKTSTLLSRPSATIASGVGPPVVWIRLIEIFRLRRHSPRGCVTVGFGWNESGYWHFQTPFTDTLLVPIGQTVSSLHLCSEF